MKIVGCDLHTRYHLNPAYSSHVGSKKNRQLTARNARLLL